MADQQFTTLTPPGNADPDTLRDRSLQSMRDQGLEPGVIDYVWMDQNGELAADRQAAIEDTGSDRFREFLTWRGIPAIEASAASSTTTWTVTSNPSDRVIPGGTQLAIGGVTFEVATDSTVTALATSVAGVAIIARDTGTTGNDLSDSPVLLEAFSWVTGITLDAPTSGGTDREADADHENRGVRRIRNDGPLVTPDNFAAAALDVPGVARVLAINRYKPANLPTVGDALDADKDGAITIVPVDTDGADVPGGVVTAIRSEFDARGMTNLDVYIINPTRTTVNITATVTRWDYITALEVKARAQAAIAAFLDPATYGAPPVGELPAWNDEPTVRRADLYRVIGDVDGVRHVTALTINGSSSADLTLTGPAALPTLSTNTVTVA